MGFTQRGKKLVREALFPRLGFSFYWRSPPEKISVLFWTTAGPQVLGAEAGKQGISAGTSMQGTMFLGGGKQRLANWKPWLELTGNWTSGNSTRENHPQKVPYLGSGCKASRGAGWRPLQRGAMLCWPPDSTGCHTCCRSLACRSWPTKEAARRSTNGWNRKGTFPPSVSLLRPLLTKLNIPPAAKERGLQNLAPEHWI